MLTSKIEVIKIENIIGSQILTLRNRMGYTQEDLASILNVSKQTISNWETGTKTPRMGSIQKMADHFNVTKSFIIDGYEKKEIDAVYNKLSPDRKVKVYDFASEQLEEQNRILNFNTKSKVEKEVLIAAHIKDGVTEEGMEEILSFIEKVKKEQEENK